MERSKTPKKSITRKSYTAPKLVRATVLVPEPQRLLRVWRRVLERRLRTRLRAHVVVEIHDNTHTMVTFQRQSELWRLRLHHMFLAAPESVLTALAGFVRDADSDSSMVLDGYIERNKAFIRKVSPAQLRKRLRIDPVGRHHDLSPIFDALNRRYFANRIAASAALYKAGKVEYLIVSGNQARGGRPRGGYDEPADMRAALIAAGVPRQRIYRDYAGYRTLDSIVRAKEVFGQDRVIVVSQAFHLSRALFLARARGLDDDGFAAENPALRYRLRTFLREIGARVVAVFDVWLGTPPRRLGKPVHLGVDAPT